jgi:hypothetical protein
MASGSDDLEQELLRNLRLRRKLGTEAAETKNVISSRDDVSQSSIVSGAEEVSGKDGLDEIRRELTLKRELESADLEKLRLELKLRRATDPTAAKSGVEAQCGKIPMQQAKVERHTVGVDRKVWWLLAFACLVVSIVMAFLLVYR